MTVCSVIVFSGGRLSGSFVLEKYKKNVVSFGRSNECDIVIRNQMISGCHGCFYKEKGVWYVQDMQSRNGILVDDRKVTGVPLIPGKKYILDGKGEVFFGVRVEQRAESHVEPRVERRVESRVESHAEKRVETHVEPHVEKHVESRVESRVISENTVGSITTVEPTGYKEHSESDKTERPDIEPVVRDIPEKVVIADPPKDHKEVEIPEKKSKKKNITVDGKRVCPKCGGTNCQILSETNSKGKDFGAGKGCLGYICFGPIGILCGACGKGKQMKTTNFWYCPDCGNRFKL